MQESSIIKVNRGNRVIHAADGRGSMKEPPGMWTESSSPLPRARGLQICCQFFFFIQKRTEFIYVPPRGGGAWEQEMSQGFVGGGGGQNRHHAGKLVIVEGNQFNFATSSSKSQNLNQKGRAKSGERVLSYKILNLCFTKKDKVGLVKLAHRPESTNCRGKGKTTTIL